MKEHQNTKTKFEFALELYDAGYAPMPLCCPSTDGEGCRPKHHGPECKKPGKTPLIRWEEYQQHRPTRENVRRWFTKWTKANIGLLTGRHYNLVVIDCDSQEAVDWLVKEYPEIAITLRIRSSRGQNFLLRGAAFKTIRHKLHKDIEVLADGAYIVVPPSRHRKGVTYEWI